MDMLIKEDLDRMIKEISMLEKALQPQLEEEPAKKESKRKETVNSLISEGLDNFETPVSNIKVFGVGGAGCNTATNLYELFKDSETVEVYAVNTDVYQLRRSKAHYKILIGRNTCRGYGAGNNPEVGEAAMKESIEDVKELLEGTDIVFVTCGLGGGTGSGAAPVLIRAAKELGILTVAVCTLPFTSEGKKKFENAKWALDQIIEDADTYIFIKNDKLIEIAPKISILQAFKLADSILMTAIKAITEMALDSGAINVDFADVLQVLRNGKTAVIGIGEADTSVDSRGIAAVQKALTNPLLDVDISTASKALVNIAGDPNIGVDDVDKILEYVGEKIGSDKEIIWGYYPDESLENTVRVTVIMAGIEADISNPFSEPLTVVSSI
ncbi:MAG: cell division protein FtsZ [Candidatus Njordarchaeia archaeon]